MLATGMGRKADSVRATASRRKEHLSDRVGICFRSAGRPYRLPGFAIQTSQKAEEKAVEKEKRQ